MTVAIDGPAASGKSTTARAVAERLGYCHLNSGQLYRAITWAALEDGWIDDESRFEVELASLELKLTRTPPTFSVRVSGRDPGEALALPRTAARVSEVSARAEVRLRVLELLRAEGREGGVVCDGRDIGTVVFPGAELKIFLVASAEERGRRRLLDHGVEATSRRISEQAERLMARDVADSTRAVAPLRRAPDAVKIDTTGVHPDDVVEMIVRLAEERGVDDQPGPEPTQPAS
jgi:cytidylate kinase